MKNLIFAFTLILSSQAFAQSKATLKLFKAIEKNDTILAQNALKEGADKDGFDSNDKVTKTTALIRAAQLDRPEIVKLLLSNHADPNLRRPFDNHSALMVAANRNLSGIVLALLRSGADVNAETFLNRTALHIAALNNSLESVEALLTSESIDVNIRPNVCALAVASRQGHISVVRLLKKQTGAKASSPVCVEAALRMATLNNHEAVISILSTGSSSY